MRFPMDAFPPRCVWDCSHNYMMILVWVIACGSALPVHGQILVPDDYQSIQTAIDSASPGDTIIVSTGTYYENILFDGKDLILRSTDPNDLDVVAATIIDGGHTGSVVTMSGDETSFCIISGFTITHGQAQYGGGINGNKSKATITKNIIESNISMEVEWSGGGGGLHDCDGLIENNIISENTSDAAGGGLNECDGTIQNNQITNNIGEYGAGLNSCSGTIHKNTITENHANGGSVMGMGGGLRFCSGNVSGNLIADNIADDSGGGLIYCGGIIQGNQIINNESHDEGGGIESCNGIIRNNLIAGNRALDGMGYGGGIANCYGKIINNTIVANHCEKNGGGMHDCKGFIANNIIWSNTANAEPQLSECSNPFYCCIDDPSISGIEICTSNPQFVDFENGDYHLSPSSWCVNSAYSFYIDNLPQSDIDGECRWAGTAIDIGCDETASDIDIDGDILADADESSLNCNIGLSDTDSDGLMDGLEVKRTTNPAVADSPGIILVPSQINSIQQSACLAFPGDVISIANGTYYENLLLTGRDIVLQSQDPYNQIVIDATVIDGRNSYNVITFEGNETSDSSIRGLTICNGSAPRYGGGIEGNSCEAIIEYCRVRNNYSAIDGGGIHRINGHIRYNYIEDNWAYSSGGGISSGSAVIEHNIIQSNSAERDDGGGICSAYSTTIQFNLIQSNYARDDGGAIKGGSALVIFDNTIIANTADDNGGGIYEAKGTFMNNIIKSNQAAYHGAAMGDCMGDIRNNLIVDNISTNASNNGDSAALYDCKGIIQNNTIVNNQAQTGGAAMASCQGIIINCIIWGNTSSTNIQLEDCSTPLFCCIEGWTGGGPGNIALVPGFEPQDDLYHLADDSTCIDAGNTFYLMGDYYFDIDKQSRLHGSRLDIGADEYGSEDDDDGDLLSNTQEAALDLKSDDQDTDDDGLKDGVEILRGTDPKVPQIAGELHIPNDYPTIQQAIFLAMPNETITVAQSTYYENLLFLGNNLILQGSNPLDEGVVNSTIIDGGNAYSCITLTGNEDNSCAIRGLTIRNGLAPQSGGGINGNGADALIEYNNITSNESKWFGGGISSCYGIIRNNIIQNNSCPYTFGSGGGLYSCGGWIHHNTITDNWVEGSLTDGGGLYNCNALIEYNTISNNSAGFNGGGLSSCSNIIRFNDITDNSAYSGGGLYNCNGTVENNFISRNKASMGGGGLSYCAGEILNNIVSYNMAKIGGGLDYCRATISRNNIEFNEATENGGGLDDCDRLIDANDIHHNTATIDGGGLNGCDGTIRNNLIHNNTASANGGGLSACTFQIQNNTIAFNSATVQGGGLYECDTEAVNCIIWENAAPTDDQATPATSFLYCCVEGLTGDGTSNLYANPEFVNLEQYDFHLSADSPCVDAGGLIDDLVQDFSGTARGFDGTSEIRGDGSDYDIGAYEYYFIENAVEYHWILYK